MQEVHFLDGVDSPIFHYFCVFLCYFRVNSIERSYRKAIINYLRENNANFEKYFTFGRAWRSLSTPHMGRIKVYDPMCSA